MKFSAIHLTLTLLFIFSCGQISENTFISKPDGLVSFKLSLDAGKVQVDDGDTFKVIDPEADGEVKESKIRILGIDTPEKGRIKGMEPYGLEATRFLEKKLEGLSEIEALLWSDSGIQRDPFGRILAEPFVNGEYPSRELLKNGLAISCFFSNSIALSEFLIPLQNEAISKKLGFWALNEGSNPDSSILLERIIKNCDGIPGGSNLNMLGESQLKQLPGMNADMSKSLKEGLGEISSWQDLELLMKKDTLFSDAFISNLKLLHDRGLFVLRESNFGFGPIQGVGVEK